METQLRFPNGNESNRIESNRIIPWQNRKYTQTVCCGRQLYRWQYQQNPNNTIRNTTNICGYWEHISAFLFCHTIVITRPIPRARFWLLLERIFVHGCIACNIYTQNVTMFTTSPQAVNPVTDRGLQPLARNKSQHLDWRFNNPFVILDWHYNKETHAFFVSNPYLGLPSQRRNSSKIGIHNKCPCFLHSWFCIQNISVRLSGSISRVEHVTNQSTTEEYLSRTDHAELSHNFTRPIPLCVLGKPPAVAIV